MRKCESCGSESYRDESRYCLKCGHTLPERHETCRQNICTNPDCSWHNSKFIYPDDARFCDVCGSATVYGK